MEFQGERLRFARKRRQMTQVDLARAVAVTSRTVQRYEQGAESPNADTMAKIVSTLAFPSEFFADPRPLPDIPERALSFRAYTKLKARHRDNAIAVAAFAVEISEWLSQRFNLPALRVPDLAEVAHSPVIAAQLLRSEWGLGHGPISNMLHLLEAQGARVFSLAEDASDVDAFCFWHENTPLVVLNQLKSGERSRFDAAHELAHLVCHRHIDFTGRDVEREADAFAAEFLVPADSLRAQLPSLVTLDTVMKLKQHWNVSAMAMVRRLKDIGKLSDWVYRGMCMDLAQRGYRSGEPGGSARETSSVLPDVLAALEEEGGGIRDVAGALKVRVSDVAPLMFGATQSRTVQGRLRLIRGGVGA